MTVPSNIPSPDTRAEESARLHQQQLTKPAGSLGRLEELACWFAARLRAPIPPTPVTEIFVFAADHGVAAQGVSAFPQAVTGQMVANFAAGGAAINVLASFNGCRIEVVDVGVASDQPPPAGVRNARVRAGTRDLSVGPAMTTDEVTAALDAGAACAREAAARGAQLLIAGDMGIANTTAAACLICALTGAAPEQVVGRGTGVDDRGLTRKREVVSAALARALRADGASGTAANPSRAQRLLAELGGLEIAAMAGFYLEAARRGVPILLDGFISTASGLTAAALDPAVSGWMLASHRSVEAGHSIALQSLGLEPLLDLKLRLGEGSGAAVALPLVRTALALHRGMATFAQAGVSERS
jgi:nicotinate-nucleotide--dimethylbenzimidazole phosphoribosyltransferase